MREHGLGEDKGDFGATEYDPITGFGVGSGLYVDSIMVWISAARKICWRSNRVRIHSKGL